VLSGCSLPGPILRRAVAFLPSRQRWMYPNIISADPVTLSPHPATFPTFPPFHFLQFLIYAKRIATLHPFFLPILVSVIRQLDDDDAIRYAVILIRPNRIPSRAFLQSLSKKDCAIVLRACLLVYSLTRGKIVPHQGQLEASLASLSGRDSSVIARTGYGKTLCIAIPLLLEPCPVRR
jgi:hypothetical protein